MGRAPNIERAANTGNCVELATVGRDYEGWLKGPLLAKDARNGAPGDEFERFWVWGDRFLGGKNINSH